MASTHRIRPPASASTEQASPVPQASRARTEQERLTYLREVCELLWPPPVSITADHDAAGWAYPIDAGAPDRPEAAHAATSEFLLLPGFRTPRLLVPAVPDAAAAAVRRYGPPGSRLTRLGLKALSAGLTSGFGATVLGRRIRMHVPAGTGTIESYLSEALSLDIRVSIYLGSARANRKPVLQLLTTAGETIGFAKIGINPLTRSLVRAERNSLRLLAVAGVTEFTVPEVLHYDSWNGLEILVLGALPVWLPRRRLSPEQFAAAVCAVSRVDGVSSGPLLGSSYLQHLRDRLAIADEGADHTALTKVLDAAEAQAGDTLLTYGAWHGDLTRWNMASTDQGLLVWDWERFTTGVPVGFDALHHWLQTEVGPRSREPMSAAADCLEQSAQLLSPFAIAPAQARLTATLYLADLAIRYLVDRQAEAGARRGAPGDWLIPAITDELTRL